MILANISAYDLVRFVYSAGRFILDDGDLPIPSALWDSGALHASYISEDFLQQHYSRLEPYLQSSRSRVRLAAGKAPIEISHRLILETAFMDSSQLEYSSKLCFYVLPESENPVVIGLPAIVMSFGKIYVERIQQAIAKYSSPTVIQHIAPYGEDLRAPFSIPPYEEAPEDEETPLPCSFTDALHFMEMTPEEAQEEFFGQFDDHISPAFRNATNVDELLRTKGVNVFVPQNWEGIRTDPLELKWKAEMPERMKPRARPVNPRLYDAAKKEFDRLLGYFYAPSDSPIASCLVIAPKATKPFIRFCGDYVTINKYIHTGHYPIPHVQRSLEKIQSFKVFLDLDLVNSFHQFRLAAQTSRNLSVQTPWGQVAPKFLPEGVAPATFVLQEHVTKIFSGFEDWTLVLFDNILVLALDYDDAYRKLEILLDRCAEYNLYLKFAKTWLGFEKVHFFGYDCENNSYSISQDRKKVLSEYSPPQSQKQMQSFLGAALYFKSFVPHYSTLAAPLNEMTKKDHVWNNDTWTPERLRTFEIFKTALVNSFALFYPDYNLVWILRTDASLEGVGMALFQVYQPSPDAEPEYQLILLASQKFSPQARRWTTLEQEGYGVYFGVKTCSYYLRCKEFILETDHANLQWIEASEVPKVIRWRIYLQSFNFSLRHIKGKQNLVADWLSRSHNSESIHALICEDPFVLPQLCMLMQSSELLADSEEYVVSRDIQLSANELFKKVHGGRMGHMGARRTWLALNKHFPGHRIPFRIVEELVSDCAICQKERLGMETALKPIYRTLKTGTRRKRVGVDSLTITPVDKNGNSGANVIVVEATKLTAIYPHAQNSGLEMALALFRFYSTYGVFEEIISDPGSDLTSEIAEHLNKWFGIRHVFSLVNRHESNGVERTNKEILRHLRALVADERVANRWSDPTVICLIQYILNSTFNSESNMVPFNGHFGNDDHTYLRLPEATSATETAHEFVKLLDSDLRSLWETSKKHQQQLIAKRSSGDSDAQNQYQPGDLVLCRLDPNTPRPSKLTLRYKGPFEVITQYKNDVECRHLCMKTVSKFYVEDLKLYTGTREDAEAVALLDFDQYEVDRILYYRGNPEIRTTMEFYIKYKDDDEKWVTWNKDLFESVPYEEFCRKHPPLFPLIFTKKIADQKIREINATPITEVIPGSTVYVDVRSRGGTTWYNSIGLPDSEKLTYVLRCVYGQWMGRAKKKIKISCEVTNEEWTVDHYFVRTYGCLRNFNKQRMVLIDQDLCRQYPLLLPH